MATADHDAVHVVDVGLGNTDDPVILDWASANGRVIVTSDTDFGGLLAAGGGTRPSVVLLRSSDHLTPDEQADLLLRGLPLVADDLDAGAVVTLSRECSPRRSYPEGVIRAVESCESAISELERASGGKSKWAVPGASTNSRV